MELIKVYDNTIHIDTCNEIIELFENEKKKYKGVTAKGFNVDFKNTTDFSVNKHDNNWKKYDDILYSALNKYLEIYFQDILKINNNFGFGKELDDKGFLIQKYIKNTGYFKYHDDFSITIENDNIFYRKIVFIFYLNDVDTGGETELLDDYKIKPKAGRLLFFPATWTYPHRGCMPISDNKYIATGWLYEKKS